MLAIIEPETPQQFDDVRQLCWEYRDFLIGLGGKSAQVCLRAYPHDQYDALMQTLETYHARPDGGLRLAIFRGEPVGCGMFQKFEPDTAEIKRVFVREAARGTGAGRGIMNALIRDCRDRGYDRILMDTGKILTAARGLYSSLGFAQRGPYQEFHKNAFNLLTYFEMDLRESPSVRPGQHPAN